MYYSFKLRLKFFKLSLHFILILGFVSVFKDGKFLIGFVTHGYDLMNEHNNIVEEYFSVRKHWETSNLGKILFQNVDRELFPKRKKTFLVVIGELSWGRVLARHSMGFGESDIIELSSECSVKNCVFTNGSKNQRNADAVVVDITAGMMPSLRLRTYNQRWIFLSEVSPMFMPKHLSPYYTLSALDNVFNWTMTYRSDSDIPIPYGRTLPRRTPLQIYLGNTESALQKLVPYWSEKQTIVPAAMVLGNCRIKTRIHFLEKLKELVKVKVIGPCYDWRRSCFNHPSTDCEELNGYLFYLAFENSKCRQFITQHVFHNAYSKGAIPVILGPPKEDCIKLLPPNSYLHVGDYRTIKDLAYELKAIASNVDLILQLHLWRISFETTDEYGLFGTNTSLFCRICEALNYNDGGAKSYDNDEIRLFTNKKIACDVNYV